MIRFLFILVLFIIFLTPNAYATWSDSGYQWNTKIPFTLSVTDTTTGAWPARVQQAISDWNTLATGVVSLKLGKSGKVTIQDAYGSGNPCAYTLFHLHSGHVANALVFLDNTCQDNQTEFYKQFAICQELGHALGLPNANLDPTMPSCMAPTNPATHPSADDIAELHMVYN